MKICDLLVPSAIVLNATPFGKEDAINILVDALDGSGAITDKDRFKLAVLDRERKGSTGFGDGVAIPHAKSAAVKFPALSAMVVKSGIDFDSLDGKKAQLFFLIASPHKASEEHLNVLAKLSTLLIDEKFRASLINANTVDEFLSYIDMAENSKEQPDDKIDISKEALKTEDKKYYDLVAVTACPAGLSHTYMAAEALEKAAKNLGLSIKVEADGAAGNRNKLLADEIAHAKAVIVAADREVDIDRFVGKRLLRTGVIDGVKRPTELIEKALSKSTGIYTNQSLFESTNILQKLYRHLMSGLTYLLPVTSAAGIILALSTLGPIANSPLGVFLDNIGTSLATLIFPVLSAFIAFSIAGRMALVAGFTGGIMANLAYAGIIGSVVNGFCGGAIAYMCAKFASKYLKGHDAMFALLVYPLAGAIGTTIIAQFVTNSPCQYLQELITYLLAQSNIFVLSIIGAILAGMMSYDMGGPLNKLAYAIGVLLLANDLPQFAMGTKIMAAVMLGGMVPPISAALASRLLAPSKFTIEEKKFAPTAMLKGALFVTEGVLAYIKDKPFSNRLCCIIGSATAGFCSMLFGVSVVAPHGGILLIILCANPLYYLLSLIIGVLVGSVLFALVRKNQYV